MSREGHRTNKDRPRRQDFTRQTGPKAGPATNHAAETSLFEVPYSR